MEDSDWWPDPERSVESYADSELRFLPIYRFVKEQANNLSDSETLAFCRKMIAQSLEPDEELGPTDAEPLDHEWEPSKPEAEYEDKELRFTPIYRFCQRQGMAHDDAGLIAACRHYLRWHEEQNRDPDQVFKVLPKTP